MWHSNMTTLNLLRNMMSKPEQLKLPAPRNRGSRITPAVLQIGRLSAITAALISLVCSGSLRAQSLLTQKPEDPGAVVVTPDQFPVKADGVADGVSC